MRTDRAAKAQVSPYQAHEPDSESENPRSEDVFPRSSHRLTTPFQPLTRGNAGWNALTVPEQVKAQVRACVSPFPLRGGPS